LIKAITAAMTAKRIAAIPVTIASIFFLFRSLKTYVIVVPQK
jgi:hypothetical protein